MKKILFTTAVATVFLGGCSGVQQAANGAANVVGGVASAAGTVVRGTANVAGNVANGVASTVNGATNVVTNGISTRASMISPAPTSGSAGMYPPNARPGECYARVLIPGTYKTVSARVLAKAAGSDVKIIPATYRTVMEKVLVSEATTKLQVIPETYKTITEKVLVEPAREELREMPTQYKTVTEKLLVKPAYTSWKRGANPISGQQTKLDQSTGEIMCLITVPAEYRTITKQVVARQAGAARKVIPAKYRTVTKRVVATSAKTKKMIVPAQYKTVQVRKLVTAAKTIKRGTPAQYKTVQQRVLASQPRMEWSSILCETNMTAGTIRRLQLALKAQGYNPGRLDGVLGQDTLNAVNRYQKANNLASGQFTIETLQMLGVQ